VSDSISGPTGSQPPADVKSQAIIRTDGLAIVSLVCGIVSLVCCFAVFGVVLGPTATVMGFISRRAIAASDGALRGGWLADLGLVLGVLGFVASLAALLLYLRGPISLCVPGGC
jgi:hypothetical protein